MRFTTNNRYTFTDELDYEYYVRIIFEVDYEDVMNFILDYFEIKNDREKVYYLLDCIDADVDSYIKIVELQDDLYEWCKDNNIDIEELMEEE